MHVTYEIEVDSLAIRVFFFIDSTNGSPPFLAVKLCFRMDFNKVGLFASVERGCRSSMQNTIEVYRRLHRTTK